MRFLPLVVLLLAFALPIHAEQPRTLLKAPPRINGREVKELVLTAPVHVGAPLGPGMPTSPEYMVKPNRFVPVSEDEWYVYYQTDGAVAEGNGQTGGLRLDKEYPDRVALYLGNARYPKIKLGGGYLVFNPSDARKIRVHYVR